MIFETPTSSNTDWLFDISGKDWLPSVDGLIAVDGYNPVGRVPEEVSIMEKARSYCARAVFFEAARNGRGPVAQAFLFDADTCSDDTKFAELHKRLWSWGGVPLLYRAGIGKIELFRCAHGPDFLGPDNNPVCRPVETLKLGAKVAAHDAWWDASRIRNGTIWDDPAACKRMLSSSKGAHRTLVEEVRELAAQLNEKNLLPARLRRRLLILSLLIAYLEERSVLRPEDFAKALPGATRFFEVLDNGDALISLLEALESRFNGHVFRLVQDERSALMDSDALTEFVRLVEGREDSKGQLSLWRLYSFRDLPVELISNIYQLFVENNASSIYTPPALVRLMLEETLSWDKLDELMSGDGVILDPACGSGVFLVEAYKRLVLHWRLRNNWARPGIEELRPLLKRVHGIDLEESAVELAAFSLCLSLCDALEPEDIRSSVKLFPPLAGSTLHQSCFFEAKENKLVSRPVEAIVGNPPFESQLSSDGAERSYIAYFKEYGALADKQLAYLFLHEAMEILEPNGILAMIEPSGFLYNHFSLDFRQKFFGRWRTREILDFVSVRGLFKKGSADPKVVVVIAEGTKPDADNQILHAVFRRNGRATAEQGFDIDYYDLFWVRNALAEKSRDIWRSNLLGGSRVHDFIGRLRRYPTLRDFAEKNGWDFGEGYIAGKKGISRPAEHLVGKPLLPTSALSADGIDARFFDTVPDQTIKDTKTKSRFTPPFLLIKENEDLHHGFWDGHYLVFKHRIVGFAAKREDRGKLKSIENWLAQEKTVLRAFVAGVSASLFVQRATAILGADIYALPYPEDWDLELSDNERIIASDIVEYQRDYVRKGTESDLMKEVRPKQLTTFDQTLVRQIGSVYYRNPLRAVQSYDWPGVVCRAYAFGDGDVDWANAEELRIKLNVLLREKKGTSLTITRITRMYDQKFLFLLKPDRHRFWTKSIALRDADDILADLRDQGF